MKFSTTTLLTLAMATSAIAAPAANGKGGKGGSGGGNNDNNQCKSGSVKSCCNSASGAAVIDALFCNVIDILNQSCDAGDVYCCDNNSNSGITIIGQCSKLI